MMLDTTKLAARNGYLEGTAAAAPEQAAAAVNYKRRISGSFLLLDPTQIDTKVAGTELCVTRKLDGEMQAVVFKDDEIFMISSGGTVRAGLPCLADAARQLKAAGHSAAFFVAELHAAETGGRTRCHDVTAALGDSQAAAALCLSPFDLVELDGKTLQPKHYRDTYAMLTKIFNSPQVRPVPMRPASSRKEVAAVFAEWALEGGAEGLVVRSELPIIYKIKQRHTIDAVIIGYTRGDGENLDKVRTLLVAVMLPSGELQKFGTTGNGFTEPQKAEVATRLAGLHAVSNYIETDSRGVAFQMVRPEIVVELSFNDLIAEGITGAPKLNTLLSFDAMGYRSLGMVPGVTPISLVVDRIRDDKTAEPANVRISQLSDICPFAIAAAPAATGHLKSSEIICRKAFRKVATGKVMVHKFVVWQTNKEQDDPRFPAFVLHHTDFSSGRKEMLKRDLRISSQKDQILAICDALIAENIKKGWEPV